MKKGYILLSFISAFILLINSSFSQTNLDSGLVACYPFSGDANDFSGNKHNGIVNGATLTTDRFGNANSAYSFNGTSNSISIVHFDSLVGTANEVSVSVWALATSNTSNGIFMLSPDTIPDRFVGCGQYLNTIYWDYGNILVNGRSTASQTYDNNWHHYVYIMSQSKNIKQVYLDNAMVINTTYGGSLINRKRTLLIGAGIDADGGGIRFHGSIDDMKFYNRALTGTEVNALYNATSGACPQATKSSPTDSGIVLCLPFHGNAEDYSGHQHNGVIHNATLTTDRLGNANSAYYFDGTDAYIAVNNFDSLSKNNEMTICFWAQATVSTSNAAFMLSPDTTTDRLVGCVEYLGNIYWDYGNILTNGRSVVGQTFDTNWHHYAFVMSQSKNIKQVYEDKVAVINTTYGSSLIGRKGRSLYIGAGIDADGGGIRFHGSISEFQMFSYPMTSADVTNDYSNFECVSQEGIESYMQTITLTTYPNPSTGNFTMDFGSGTQEDLLLNVYNSVGQRVATRPVPTGSTTVQLNLGNSLSSGLYSLILQSKSGIKTRKIIISK